MSRNCWFMYQKWTVVLRGTSVNLSEQGIRFSLKLMLNRHRRNSVNNERREHCAAIQEPSMGRAGPSAFLNDRPLLTGDIIVYIFKLRTI